MMTPAYQETYLNKAQSVLGEAFDYAVNTCHISGTDFLKLFLASPICKRMENGEPAILAGKSGSEIVIDIVFETTGKWIELQPKERFTRSREYWIGWAVAYYQWLSSKSYEEIFRYLSYDDLAEMYNPLHEADLSKFADIMNQRMKNSSEDTNLKRLRKLYGLTQSELSKQSGVTLRSIQMYEQRNKDINKASADTLYKISKVLGCTMEQILEK